MKMVWRFLKKLRIKPPYDLATPLWGIYPEETKIERDTCIPLFIATLFIIARTWKQPRCPLIDEWIKKLWCIYTVEYSVQFNRSVVSNSLWPRESQHSRPPCPTPAPGVYTNSCPLSQWCQYLDIKRSTFESVLMKWMNLEPTIQSEVSQKVKDKYRILTHIYIESRERVLKNLFTGQQWRNRHRE